MELLKGIATITLCIGCIPGMVIIIMVSRARAMRALAARWGFQYMGPSSCRFGFPSVPKIKPSLPASLSLDWRPADRIRQAWNVIEGQPSGMSVLIFDSDIGTGRPMYCTFIACQTEENPFGVDTRSDVIQSGGWWVLYRYGAHDARSFQMGPWSMAPRGLDKHLKKLRGGSGV